MKQRTLRHCGTILLVLLLLSTSSAFAQCGDNSPAFPVPQTVNSVTLWPPSGFRPVSPGSQLPAERDSTDYLSTTIPGRQFGHELFQSLDVVNTSLYVAYNAGVQVWNISGGNAGNPLRIHSRDGWLGEFQHFPAPGEASNFIDDIAAEEGTGGNVHVMVSGRDQVGTSIWLHSGASFTQIAQHTDVITSQVRTGSIGTVAYGFAASSSDGLAVFNASTGSFLGSLSNDTDPKRYLDTLEKDGKIFVAGSNGNSVRMKIWEVANPSVPSSAIVRYNGESLGSGIKDVALFEHAGNTYMALIQFHDLYIYDIDNCIDVNGCTNPGSAIVQIDLPGATPAFEYLTYSVGPSGTPFLYVGLETLSMSGTRREGLYDVSNLGGSNVITEVTAGGGVYTDGCSPPNQVDYWGHYYDENENGYRNFHPRVGQWGGNVFYRVTNATLDTHVFDDFTPPPPPPPPPPPGGDPIMNAQVTSPAPYWMTTPDVSHPINFSATAFDCDGASNWTWNDNDTLSTVSGTSTTGVLTANVCGASDCPNRSVTVTAIKNICSGDPNLVVNGATVTVQEPRAQIRSLDVSPAGDPVGVYPVCTVLDFTSSIEGKTPYTYSWTVTNDQTSSTVASGSGTSLQWDTTGQVAITPIFVDGFESGDTAAWSSSVPVTAQSFSPMFGEQVLGKQAGFDPVYEIPDGPMETGQPEGAGSTYTVRLDVTNLSGTHQTEDTTTVTLVGLGTLSFDQASPISSINLGDGLYQITANTFNATEWKWQVENDNGVLETIDWDSENQTLNYQWTLPGIRTVIVEARNCENNPISTGVNLNVTDPNPPEMVNFLIEPLGSKGCFTKGWNCLAGTPIFFTAITEGFPTEIELDWNGDGDVDATVAVGDDISNTYSTIGTVNPQARAKKGTTVSDWLGLEIQIVN